MCSVFGYACVLFFCFSNSLLLFGFNEAFYHVSFPRRGAFGVVTYGSHNMALKRLRRWIPTVTGTAPANPNMTSTARDG
jgi:hypothetical protein